MRFSGVSSYLRAAWSILFPRRCLICGQTLTESEEYICAVCHTTLPLARLDPMKDNAMTRLFFDIPGIQRATAYLRYAHGNTAFHLIHHLKYHDRPATGVWLGKQMAYHFQASGFFEGIDAIVPVPLFKKKMRKRGYNQSEAIAQGISSVTGIPVRTDLVSRTINNPTQTKLTTIQRRENVAGIFSVKDADALATLPTRHATPHILLIDDVITTGSTLHSFAETLSAAANLQLSYLAAAIAGQHLNVFERGAE